MRLFKKIINGEVTNDEFRNVEVILLRDELAEIEEGMIYLKVGIRDATEKLHDIARDAKRNNETSLAFDILTEVAYLQRIASVISSLEYDEELEAPQRPTL